MIDHNFVNRCVKDALLLQGKLIALQDEKKSIVSRVETAKLWLNKQPDYVKFLQHLQNILHQKNIGAFSELLSYFVKDILQKDKEIIFDLYTYHNLPALKIEALNNGCRENIYEGNGGSIANIVSTGLRLIALSRLNHRKFIILDEPDCWLKPEHVPLFAKIIGEISSQLNIQTVIISHHHWKYFKDYGRVIELKEDGPHLTTEIIHDTIPAIENKNIDVIEKIVLSKFMSHYETIFELHPNLTCIIGENDIGKSVLATAMKSVSYADSSDSYIMHHENEAKTLIELTGKKQILWQRFRETDQENTQKVKYSLFFDGNLQHSEYSSHDTPTFINKELNICTTEDIDVHIGNQKQPVFLLSPETKPQQRAKILSLGKESLIIQKMMENIKIKTRQFKHTIKEGEERFSLVNQQISVLENIDDLVQRAEKLKETLVIYEQQDTSIEELKQLINSLEDIDITASTNSISNHYIEVPQLKPTYEIDSIINEYYTVDKLVNIGNIKQVVDMIELHPYDYLFDILSQLDRVTSIADIDCITLLTDTPTIKSTQEIDRAIELIGTWEKMVSLTPIKYEMKQHTLQPIHDLVTFLEQIEEHDNHENDLNAKKIHLEKWTVKLAIENKQYLEELGSVCPTCKQHVTEEHLKGNQHA